MDTSSIQMQICTDSAPQGCVSGCSGDAAEYSGVWIGGAYRRVPAREPLGLGAGRHLSLFPAAAAHTPVLAQPDIPTGREEDMDDGTPHMTVQVATTQGGSDVTRAHTQKERERGREGARQGERGR